MVERGPRVYSSTASASGTCRSTAGSTTAVRDRDPERAAKLMREHIEELARRYRVVGACS